MIDHERFDFSKESDLKARLWEQMQQRMTARSEVSFDSLGRQALAPSPAVTERRSLVGSEKAVAADFSR